MTAHFIEMPLNESSSVSQASVSLACRRFYGSHTYDTIAAMISQIHCQYDLNIEKISATVTDNASNFGKAFRELFEESTTSAAATSVSVTITLNASEEQEDMEENTVNDYEIDLINIGGILSFS